MDNQSLQTLLGEKLPDLQVIQGTQFVEITMAPESLHEVLTTLKIHQELKFNFLHCQTGVDINGRLGVVYHLRSTVYGHSCVCKVFTDNRENPVFDTASDLWSAAQSFEREIFDLLGVKFTNHPNLKRIFLEDDFVGYPLRKDFEDPINIIHK